MQAFVFVDYDNVIAINPELNSDDAVANIVQIADRAMRVCRVKHNGASEIVLRLYSGWTDINGAPTDRAVRVYKAIPKVPRRIGGVRLNLEVTVSPIGFDVQLKGLLRNGKQKMVDTLIACDLTWCALSIDCPLILMSDDEDLVPGALTAAGAVERIWNRRPICLSRSRDCGAGANDDFLSTAGIFFDTGVF